MKKPRGGNDSVVNDLVERSYSMRRRDILSTPRDISAIFQKYPFLKKSLEQASAMYVVVTRYVCFSFSWKWNVYMRRTDFN